MSGGLAAAASRGASLALGPGPGLPGLAIGMVPGPDPELLRACRRDPGTGPAPAAGLVAGQRGAGECGDERGRGYAAGEQGPLAVGSDPPVIKSAQQPGDDLGVT